MCGVCVLGSSSNTELLVNSKFGRVLGVKIMYSIPPYSKNPLKWWDHYAERFPTLAKLARKFLCIMGTSVPSERVFSVAGLTVTKTRSRLDSEVVNEIISMNKVLHKKFKETSTKEEIKQDPDSEQSTSVSDQSELPLPALY